MTKIAIIDLGSNSIRMNITSINEKQGYSLFDSAKEIVRLGEGLHETGKLGEIPMQRTYNALAYFKELIEIENVDEVYALSTAAVRLASNKDEFINTVAQNFNLHFKVLSGNQEAYFDYLGVINSMTIDNAVMIDTGGGSTEIAMIQNRILKHRISIPLGAVTLTESYDDEKSQKKKIKEASKLLKEKMNEIPWLDACKGYEIIGLGGSNRTLAKLDRSSNGYVIRNLHNYALSVEEVDDLIDLILSLDKEDLRKLHGINGERSELIHMGVLPLKVLGEKIHYSGLRISGRGLRDGYFDKIYAEKFNRNIIVDDVIKHSAYNFLKRFESDIHHAEHVNNLSMQIFHGTGQIHDFDNTERGLLEIACLLHDIGMKVEYYNHNITGMYLILNSKVKGLRNLENLKVAYLVGLHSGEEVRDRMEIFSNIINKKDLKRMEKLSVFLQIAEKIDRCMSQHVKALEVSVDEEEVIIGLKSKDVPTLEILAVNKISDQFKKYYHKDLRAIHLEGEE